MRALPLMVRTDSVCLVGHMAHFVEQKPLESPIQSVRVGRGMRRIELTTCRRWALNEPDGHYVAACLHSSGLNPRQHVQAFASRGPGECLVERCNWRTVPLCQFQIDRIVVRQAVFLGQDECEP